MLPIIAWPHSFHNKHEGHLGDYLTGFMKVWRKCYNAKKTFPWIPLTIVPNNDVGIEILVDHKKTTLKTVIVWEAWKSCTRESEQLQGLFSDRERERRVIKRGLTSWDVLSSDSVTTCLRNHGDKRHLACAVGYKVAVPRFCWCHVSTYQTNRRVQQGGVLQDPGSYQILSLSLSISPVFV